MYSSKWDEPETIIPFDQIASLNVRYNDSFWEDSMVHVTTYAGMEVSFPLSSDQELDRKFVEAIRENLKAKSKPAPDADELPGP